MGNLFSLARQAVLTCCWAAPALLALALLAAGCRPDPDRAADGRTPVRVFLLLISPRQVEFYQWAEQAYEAQHPDVDILMEQFPGSSLKDYEIKVRLRYASGQPPDIWSFRETALSEFVNLGLLAPAPPYIERIVQENSLNDLIREAPYFDGVCYGIAHGAAWTALYYNKAMFREAGLDPERPPRNWDELLDYAERLTVRDAAGRITRAGLSLRKTGFKPGIAEKWLTFFHSAGGVLFNEEGTETYIDSPAGRAAFDFYRRALFERRVDAVEVEGDQQGFGQGRVAMFIRELHVVGWLDLYYPDVDFGVAPIPARDSTYTSYSSGGAYPVVVSEASPHKEEAWRFLEFLMSDEPYTKYMTMVNELPMLASVAGRPPFSEDPYLRQFIEQKVFPAPKLPHDKRSLDILGGYIERFAYGHLTLEEAVTRADAEITAYLQARYRRAPATRP